MPASASIHFCFHYASFLQSFQINFTAFLNFKAYKKNLVLLTLVNWDLFRNLEDAFALVPGVAVPLPAFSGFLALSVRKHPDPSQHLLGQRMELCLGCHSPVPCCAGSGNPSRAVLSLTPLSPCSTGAFQKSPAEAGV